MPMGLLKFLVYFVIALLILFLCIVLGDRAPWYFAWVLGSGMIILIAVSGAVLMEGQEEEQRRKEKPHQQ
jgi:predicted outer membrane lipoprotein